MTARRWCFTSYLVEAVGKALEEHEYNDTGVRGVAFQTEKCPDTSRLHIQGYAEFYAPCRFACLKRITGDNALHCERARGTREQNLNYVTKLESRADGPSGTYGAWPEPEQGKRRDLDAVELVLRQPDVPWKRKHEQLWDDHFGTMVKYQRGIGAAIQHFRLRSTHREPPRVVVLWGATGTGKTRRVFDSHADELWRSPPSHDGKSTWFDGYMGHRVALFDDFDGKTPNITMMLQILDRYPLTLPFKGGFTCWAPEQIYITTNKDPTSWYPEANDEQRAGIYRRITETVHLVNDDDGF